MAKFTDVLGNTYSAEHKVFVTATDRLMSGWGRAEHKTSKIIVVCNNMADAYTARDKMESKPELKYVNITTSLPKYPSTRYTSSFYLFEDSPRFNGQI